MMIPLALYWRILSAGLKQLRKVYHVPGDCSGHVAADSFADLDWRSL